jgi:heterodisulfide reductase subunit B
MEDAAFRQRVDALLDAPGGAFPRSRSVMQMLLEDFGTASIAHRMSRPLLGVRLAPYYGCLMSRPAEIMQFGNPENPTAMEELLRACGAEDIVDFPAKIECCGASHGIPSQRMTSRLSGSILSLAVAHGADALVVACPLCQMNLDLRQEQAAKAVGVESRIPALYFTQLMGVAFGLDNAHLGFEKLCVSVQPLLDKIRKAREEAAFNARKAAVKPEKPAGKAQKAEVRP